MEKKKKLLTISIAAYHVEKYLAECLESFAYEDLSDTLEVLVINDGSGESINQIVKQFIEKYPDIFRLIDKENGGHGSTVNRGIQEASGIYFKTVDGDDMVTEEGLHHLIDLLAKTDADMVVSDYEIFEDESRKVCKKVSYIPKECNSAKIYDWEEVCYQTYFVMHAITYRTELLRNHHIQLEEHCYYVDAQYCLFPVPWIKKVAFLNETVYCYRLGIQTQSMDILNMQKNCEQHEKVLKSLLNHYTKYSNHVDEATKKYLQKGCAKFFVSQIKIYLSYPANPTYKQKMIHLDKMIKEEYPKIYHSVTNKSVWILRKTGYISYRLASWLCRRVYVVNSMK